MGVAEAQGHRRTCWAVAGKVALRVGVGLTALAAGWLTLTIHPEPLFAYSLRQDNIVLYARAPLPKEAGPILRDALSRVTQSPLYDAAQEQHAFLCDSPTLYALLAVTAHGSGKTNPFRNVFIRPANVARNRIIERSGLEKPAPRTLAYVIAHEVTHSMTFAHLGLAASRTVSAYQGEGYADYVALGPYPNLRAGRDALKRNAFEMNVTESGRYDRYRLLVSYLLDARHLTLDQVLTQHVPQKDVVAQLLAEPSL